MKKWFVWPVLLAGVLCACGAQPTGKSAVTLPMNTERPVVVDLPADEAGPTPEPTPAAETTLTAADLTLEEKVGQLFIIRPDSLDLTLPQEQIDDAKADGVTELTDAMRDALQKYPVGGVCQFGKNIVDPEQITAFNAALAGVSVTGAPGAGSDTAPSSGLDSEADAAPESGSDAGHLELLRGSLLEPVAGRRFDLIASNPPFVLTPPAVREAGLPLMEYRDAGGPILPGLVAGLGEHLEPGATAVMLGNWEHRGAGSWLPKELDAWILERELQDPVEYATMWLRDGGLTPERDLQAFDSALEAWIDDFEARDVRGVGFGYLIVHRPQSPREPWRLLEEVTTSGQGVLGPHVAEVLEVRERLAGLDDDAVADLRPLLAPDVTEERHLIPGAAEPTVILLRQGGGLGRALQASTAVAALVGVADGELSVGQVASAVAVLSELNAADALALRAEMVEATRHLLTTGFLRPGK